MRSKKSPFIILLGSLALMCTAWYTLVQRPQVTTIKTFLEALKQRNPRVLEKVVSKTEYAVYKELYLRNGYNKCLLGYKDICERDANDHFFPTSSRFSVKVDEMDMLFGQRQQDYIVALEKVDDSWRVVQFATTQDYQDLAILNEFKPEEETPVPAAPQPPQKNE